MSTADSTTKPKGPHKSARRRAREFAVQGLYQWQLTGDTVNAIERFLRDSTTQFERADQDLFRTVFYGAMSKAAELKEALAPHLDRDEVEVSPVERAILLVGAFELLHLPETPHPVIINEAIEVAKTFGGIDGHRFVNGVLDKLALACRPAEVAAGKQSRPR